MGIKNLNRNLKEVEGFNSFTKKMVSFDKCVSDIDKKDYSKLLKQYNSNNFKIRSSFLETNKICHIDFSNMMYKMLNISDSMKEAIKNCKEKIILLKKKNTVLLYIDPKIIKRKTLLKNKRKSINNNFNKKIKLNILSKIEEIEKSYPDITVNEKIKEIILNLDTKKKQSYEEYCELVKYFDNNELFTIDKNNDENKFEFLKTELFDDIDFSSDSDSENKNPLFIDVKDINLNEYDSENENKKLQIKQESIYLISKNDIFKLFFNTQNFVYHSNYILNSLLSDKIITKEEIIQVEDYDAELEIILQIKNNYRDNINIIFTTDQDVLLFGLLLFDENILVYITHKYNLNYENMFHLNKTILSKNTAILTFLIHESDYFPGFTGLTLSETKLKISDNINILSKEYNSYKELLIEWIKFSNFKPIKDYIDIEAIKNINTLFIEIEKYLSLDKNFFSSDNNIMFKIKKNDIIKYCQENN